MSNSAKIPLWLAGWFLAIGSLHVWLNIGFDQLGLFSADVREETFKVGFLPVT